MDLLNENVIMALVDCSGLDELRDILLESSDNDSTESDSESKKEPAFKRLKWTHRDRRRTFFQEIERYHDIDFKQNFHMSRTSFEMFVSDFHAEWSSGKGRASIPFSKVLLMCIWYLSTRESFQEIGNRFDMEKGHMYKICWKLFKAIYDKRKNYIQWPTDLKQVALSFNAISPENSFPNVVGCIDCLKITASRKTIVKVQGVCDSNMIFTDVLIRWPGDISNEVIFRESPLYSFLNEESNIDHDSHLLGNISYPLLKYLMCPYSGNDNHLTVTQEIFNLRHQSAYLKIKCAFSKIMNRFERLKSFMEIKHMDQAKYYIMTAFVLHNFILLNEIDTEEVHQTLTVKGEDMDEDAAVDYNIDGVMKRDELTLQFLTD